MKVVQIGPIFVVPGKKLCTLFHTQNEEKSQNIARGTTDPEIDSVTRIKFSNNITPLALVTNLATRWRHLHWLQIWLPDGATCIGCKFGHQMAPLALVTNLATRWRHLHWLQIWPPDGTTCISCKFGHQMAQLASVQNLVISWRYLHCFQSCPPDCGTALLHCLGLPYWHYQLVLSWYPRQPESHQLSLQKVSHGRTSGPKDRTPGLPGSDKNWNGTFLPQHHLCLGWHTTFLLGTEVIAIL